MCGLVGLAAFNNFGIGIQERNIFKQLLTVDVVRGSDGTGAFIVNEDGECRSLKIGGIPHQLFRVKEWGEFFEPPYKAGRRKDIVMVGHNRLTSVGESSTENAHPHHSGPISLVHNGTIREYSKLPKMKEANVDSEALAHAIDTLGVEEAIARSHGAYAIIYHDDEANTLNFLRNSERPLWFAQDTSENRLFWASEAPMLEWVLGRNNISSSRRRIWALKPDTLVSFSLSDCLKVDFAPVISEVKGPPVTQYYRTERFEDVIDNEVEDVTAAMGNHGVSQIRYTVPDRPRNLPVLLESPEKAMERAQPQLLDSNGKVITLPTKSAKKRIMKILNGLKQMGRPVEVKEDITSLSGNKFSRGDIVAHTVKDYFDDKTAGAFIVTAENTQFPRTLMKFRVESEEALEECFNNTVRIGEIRNIAHYPTSSKEDYEYVVWIKDSRQPSAAKKQVLH